MKTKEKYTDEQTLRIYREKVLQIHKLSFMRDQVSSYRKSFSNSYEKQNIFLNIIYSSLDFSLFMVISKILDEDKKTFSIYNVLKNIKDDFLNKELKKIKEVKRILNIWRGNVFAHDNFDVALSSIMYEDMLHPDFPMDFMLKDLENFLINLLVRFEFYFYKQHKTLKSAQKLMVKELKHREGRYKQDVDLILKTFK